jgi:hypothetical protein
MSTSECTEYLVKILVSYVRPHEIRTYSHAQFLQNISKEDQTDVKIEVIKGSFISD